MQRNPLVRYSIGLLQLRPRGRKKQSLSFVLARKSYVVLDDADEGLIPNDWVHKVVRVGGGVAGGLPRFGGSYLIQLDSKLAIQLRLLCRFLFFRTPFILLIYVCEAGLPAGCGQVRTRAFEGKFEGKEFVGHDGDRREISKSDVYKLGEAWQCNGQVWAYWREEQKDLHAGWVTAVGSETLRWDSMSMISNFGLCPTDRHAN